jgi:hypothetical protein
MSTVPEVTAETERFEFATDRDEYYSYCLWPYQPPTATDDKFRGVNLLFHSFQCAGVDRRAYDLVDALRDSIGAFRTVFGIKLIDGCLGWEFYFYDYRRREREISIRRVMDALAPFARIDIRPQESLPYFMFSIDIDDALLAGRRNLDVVHMYIGNVGSAVSSGIAYGVRPRSVTLENFYFFFDARSQLDEVENKVCASPYLDSTRLRNLDEVIWPELARCHTICVANKQANDCIYYSGIDVVQLLYFLERMRYPREIVRMIEDNRANLDHLLYDVGIDYRMEGDRIEVLKSGYYNVF